MLYDKEGKFIDFEATLESLSSSVKSFFFDAKEVEITELEQLEAPEEYKTDESIKQKIEEVDRKVTKNKSLKPKEKAKLKEFHKKLIVEHEAQVAIASKEPSFGKTAGQKAHKAIELYNEFAKEHPMLAEYGLSALNVVLQTAVAGPAGTFNAIRAEVSGMAINAVAGEKISQVMESGIKAGAVKLKEQYSDMTDQEAIALSTIILLGSIAATSGVSGIKDVIKKLDDIKIHKNLDGLKVVNPVKEPLKLEFDSKKALELRNTPGSAIGGEKLPFIDANWLRGTHANVGKLPKQIADKMRGTEFKDFSQFRKTFWKLVAEDSHLSKNFGNADIKNMKSGLAPVVDSSQRVGKVNSYQLHHIKPIHDKGGVYDLDNIIIVTPRYS